MLEVVLACASTGVLVGWAGLAHQRRVVALRGFEAYGHARRLRVVAPDPAHAARAPRLEGAEGEVPVAIDVVRLDGRVWTRVVAKAPRGRCLVLRLVPAEGDVRLLAHDLPAARVVADAARPSLRVLGLRAGLWLASDGGKVVCAWPGIEQEGRILDAAIEAVAAVARSHLPEAPYR